MFEALKPEIVAKLEEERDSELDTRKMLRQKQAEEDRAKKEKEEEEKRKQEETGQKEDNTEKVSSIEDALLLCTLVLKFEISFLSLRRLLPPLLQPTATLNRSFPHGKLHPKFRLLLLRPASLPVYVQSVLLFAHL